MFSQKIALFSLEILCKWKQRQEMNKSNADFHLPFQLHVSYEWFKVTWKSTIRLRLIYFAVTDFFPFKILHFRWFLLSWCQILKSVLDLTGIQEKGQKEKEKPENSDMNDRTNKKQKKEVYIEVNIKYLSSITCHSRGVTCISM